MKWSPGRTEPHKNKNNKDHDKNPLGFFFELVQLGIWRQIQLESRAHKNKNKNNHNHNHNHKNYNNKSHNPGALSSLPAGSSRSSIGSSSSSSSSSTCRARNPRRSGPC